MINNESSMGFLLQISLIRIKTLFHGPGHQNSKLFVLYLAIYGGFSRPDRRYES